MTLIDQLLNTILKETYTLNQLKHRLSMLKLKFLQYFFGTEKKQSLLSESDLMWLKSLPPDFSKSINQDNVYTVFEDLEKKINSMSVLTMYLTFEPDELSLTQIGEMTRKTFSNLTLILDIKYDPRLLAGAALSFKGMYRDYSLRSRIEERKLAILQSFKKLLR